MTETDTYTGLFRALSLAPPRTTEDVMERIGIALSPVSEKQKLRDTGSGKTEAGLAFDEVSLSFYPDGSPNTLVLMIPPSEAPKVEDVIDVFPGLKLTSVPRGRSSQEETELTRAEGWGRLVIGIAESDRSIVRSVAFSFAASS